MRYCVVSCNRYLMLINHPTDGATRGLTLRVRLLGQNLKKRKHFFYEIFFINFFFGSKKIVKGTRHKQNSLSGNTLFNYMPTYTRSQKKS